MNTLQNLMILWGLGTMTTIHASQQSHLVTSEDVIAQEKHVLLQCTSDNQLPFVEVDWSVFIPNQPTKEYCLDMISYIYRSYYEQALEQLKIGKINRTDYNSKMHILGVSEVALRRYIEDASSPQDLQHIFQTHLIDKHPCKN